jgi:hypothetical protein
MNELKVKIEWLKNMIELHNKLGNKGLEDIFKLKLNKLIIEVVDLIK